MKFSNLRTRTIALLMLIASVVLYCVDFIIYGKATDIFSGFLGNLAFLPIYVLFVTLILERVLKERERVAKRQKMNMVIGVFFSEVGTGLIQTFTDFFPSPEELTGRLRITPQWGGREFREAVAFLNSHDLRVDSRHGDLSFLKNFLLARRDFLLRLLENPNLLEHDEFTDLLWAVFHLLEELTARESFSGLPPSDLEHLSGDIKRAAVHLLREWVIYMKHLKKDYPYLYSLAVRMNPMNPEAGAVVY